MSSAAAQAVFPFCHEPLGAAERSHPGREFRVGKRLNEIVVGPQIEDPNPFFHAVTGGHDEHRQRILCLAQFVQETIPAQIRDPEIQNQ